MLRRRPRIQKINLRHQIQLTTGLHAGQNTEALAGHVTGTAVWQVLAVARRCTLAQPCGVAYGMAWRGLAGCGIVWHGMAWCDVAWYGMAWCDMVWHGMLWRSVAWVWCGMAWCGMAWL